MRRAVDLFLALTVVVGLVVSACGSGDGGRAAVAPVETTIPEGADQARFPDDQIVWQAHTSGGLVPQVAWAAQRPTLTIYGDGRFFLATPGVDRRFDQPITIETGTVDREDLAVFVAGAEASGLFDDDVEMGSPDVTDMASTTVELHHAEGPVVISAYALGGRFDTDLSDTAVRNRETLRRLLSAAEALVPDPEPWTPTRVRLLHLPDDATYEPQPDADEDAEPAPWPGADPETFADGAPADMGSTTILGCTEVTGSEAGELFDAAVGNPLPTWEVDGEIRTIVVVALLPGEAACTT